MKIEKLAVLLSIILVCSNCTSINGSNEDRRSQDNSNVMRTTITQEKIDRNRSKWREKGSTDYDMTLRLWSHGAVPPANAVKIRVREGKRFSIEIADRTGSNVTSLYSHFETVEMIFDRISTELSDGSRVNAEFDEELGYPRRIEVQPRLSNASYRLNIVEVKLIYGSNENSNSVK